jgi:hypothetical protein
MSAIRFDNETMRDTHEVDDERTDGALAAKFVSGQAPAAQNGPQTPLGVRHIDP